MQKIFVMVFVAIVLSACSSERDAAVYAPANEPLANDIEHYVMSQDGVGEAQIVIVENYIAVSLGLSPWQRFKKQQIEKSITQYMKQRYSQYEVIVSGDRKLHFELAKLNGKDETKTLKKLKDLQELLKEET